MGGAHRVDADLDGLHSRAASAEEILLAQEELDGLLARLGPTEREVLIMRCEDCTVREIACRLGIAERTVTLRIARIRAAYLAMRPGYHRPL